MITLRRRAAAPDRIATAPAAYVAVHDRADLARHAGLLDPLPRAGEVRGATTPARRRGAWNLDIVARDRPGLLARTTGVLAAHGVGVLQAVVATWHDGAALQSFVVDRGDAPGGDEFARALDRPHLPAPVAIASVTFDNDASSAYTACEVVAADQPGLLHAIATAFADAGVDVHAASVDTVEGQARDRFDLSDRAGGKLSPAWHVAIARALRV
ncbi:MAG TPA: ACT domain-containing protein [Acidimicrobiales bacterium]|nr:ACT domain-containing protein [Acidimicrobiales bacterium]